MLKLGLVQINFQSGPSHLNAFYLPYTVGILWSYVKQNTLIKNNYSVHHWGFRRDPIDQQAGKIAKCDVAVFSMYVWNKNYTCTLIRKAKKLNPNLICIVGGPEVPHSKDSFYLEYPEIDTVIVGEGEVAVEEILELIVNKQPLPKKHSKPRLKDLTMPSPYLEGEFDDLMIQYPDIEWMPTLETDRGCPYKCTFCDWGSATNSKIIKFGLDRVFAELEWIGKKGLPFLTMTNANFGVFRERDNLIAKKIVEIKNQYGVPNAISVSYAKNSNADVFNIIKTFSDAKIGSGFSLSLQSTTQDVLEIIKRTNMKVNDIQDITQHANKYQVPLFTEIIVGLPGETYDSLKTSIYSLLDQGLHNGLDVFLLQVLENAPIQAQVQDHQIKTFKASDFYYNTPEIDHSDECVESIDTILSTETMTTEDICNAMLFAWYITGLHITGISDLMARYLHKSGTASYRDFYEHVITRLQNDHTVKQWQKQFVDGFSNWADTGLFKMKSKSHEFMSWANQYSFMVFVQEYNYLDTLLNIICDIAKYRYNVDDYIVSDYKNISHNRIKQFSNCCYEPKTINTFTNLWDFVLNDDVDVEQQQCQYTVKDRWNQFPATEKDHFDNIIFGRRRNYVLNIVDKAS